ncbi:glycosyltransferase family 4 protein [Methanolobus vulcani]|uniref:Glycosyltransferase family 4 protein n=1 Tax=Methanolobus vulcani TaxID=38026 RepID=A0A7Z8P362_9EURY|nr:glycosyltransferase family 4 protein [Methanolobus vulcani]TQD27267.1 glycosyltransferase family 4 protein [Methanolobus vulcani]
MKITYLLPHSPEVCGLNNDAFKESTHFSLIFCEKLSELNNDVELLYFGTKYSVNKKEYEIIEFPVSIGKSFGQELSVPLLKYLLTMDSDIVHIHGLRQVNLLPIVVILYLKKIPFIVHHHGGYFNYSKRKVRFFYKIMSFFLKYPCVTLSVSKIEIKNLQKSGVSANKLIHFPVGVDCSQFYPTDQAISRTKLSLNTDDIYILFVGRMVFLKGVQYLIKAISILQKNYNNVRLILVGDGPQHAYFKSVAELENVSDVVSFVGFVNNYEKLRTYYNATDICVFPSLSEGSAIVTLEAMACKKPIICTRAHLGGGIVEDYTNALIADINPSSIAEKIVELIENKSLQDSISKSGYNYVTNNLSWEVLSKKLNDIYISNNLTVD